MIIGSRYEERKDILRELIKSGNVEFVVHEEKGYGCYFCLDQIEGKAYELRLEETSYFVDSCCFGESKFGKPLKSRASIWLYSEKRLRKVNLWLL